MIIHLARIFRSSVYRDNPYWIEGVTQMTQWNDEKCLAHLDFIKENCGYICLTPAVCKEFDNVLSVKDYAGFFSLFEALRYPVFSASIITVLLQDADYLGELIRQLPSQQVQRPKMIMALIRDRWMDLMANILKQDVVMGEPVVKEEGKSIDTGLQTRLVDDLKGMLLVLGAEDMFHWAIELKKHRTMSNVVKYKPDVESVAFNRLRFFVLNTLPDLVDINSMKTEGQHLPYTLYMLCAYVHREPTNTARMDMFLKDLFSYLQSNTSPTCSNDELYHLLVPAVEAFALCRQQDSKEMISLLDNRRVNKEGWRVEWHHKRLEDDDVDTDVIIWPKHYMPRDQQEMIAFRMSWHLFGVGHQFASDKDKETYYDAISNRLFNRLKTLDGNDFRTDSYGFHSLVRLAYRLTVNAMPAKEEWFVSMLIDSIDTLFDVYMFLSDGNIQLKDSQKQELEKRFNADWSGERKVNEILNVYNKYLLDEVESELKKLI